jgi:hypothetical protein
MKPIRVYLARGFFGAGRGASFAVWSSRTQSGGVPTLDYSFHLTHHASRITHHAPAPAPHRSAFLDKPDWL